MKEVLFTTISVIETHSQSLSECYLILFFEINVL
jgi:hypothetical protein